LISKVIHLFAIEKIKRMDKILQAVLKRQIPFIIGGTITGVIVTYYYGFLFSIIVNSAIWMFMSFIVNKYYYKSTGFKDEKYLMHYAVSKLNSRSRSA
jgi:ABC-type transport system involved in Fe-S cluster assembly fused permease/ATPase subunit